MNRFLKRLLVADSFRLAADAMFIPIYALFVNDLGNTNVVIISYTAAVMYFASAAVMAIVGRYADHGHNKKKVVIAGTITLGMAYLLYTLVNSITQLVIVQIIAGIGSAIQAPAFDGLYSEHLDKHKESTEWGNWEVTASIVYGTGALIGGALVYLLGYDALFYAMTLSALISGTLLYLKVR